MNFRWFAVNIDLFCNLKGNNYCRDVDTAKLNTGDRLSNVKM